MRILVKTTALGWVVGISPIGKCTNPDWWMVCCLNKNGDAIGVAEKYATIEVARKRRSEIFAHHRKLSKK